MSKKPKVRTGRPSKYTPELVEEIAERLAKGETMSSICRCEDMPGRVTVYDWMALYPIVAEQIARAREDGHDFIAEDCLNIADDNGKDTRILDDGREVTDADVVQRAKLRIETRLKLLAKWNPKKYGDKMDLTTGGERLTVNINAPNGRPDA